MTPVSKSFKLLGKLRDHSNALSFCLEFKIDSGIFDNSHKLNAIKKKISSLIDKHQDEISKIEKVHAHRCSHINRAKWGEYLCDKCDESIHMLSSSPDNEQLHDARKSIKHLLYINELAGLDALHTISGVRSNTLDRLQETIGQWHDLVVFRDSLQDKGYDRMYPKPWLDIVRQEKKLRKESLSKIRK